MNPHTPAPLPPGSLLLVRHARATGQAPDALLTPEGQQSAEALVDQLDRLGVTRIVSSPWTRAMHTAAPLAAHLGLPVQPDGRLTERVLSGRDLPYWRTALKASFAMPLLRFPGGESGAAARRRGQAALDAARDPQGLSVVVTHGNLLALLLGLDHAGWAGLKNPDMWLLAPGAAARHWEEQP